MFPVHYERFRIRDCPRRWSSGKGPPFRSIMSTSVNGVGDAKVQAPKPADAAAKEEKKVVETSHKVRYHTFSITYLFIYRVNNVLLAADPTPR